MTSVTRAVGGCLLCRSIAIFDQHHDGFVAAALPDAVLAPTFYQFIKTHCHGHKWIVQINLWLSQKGAQPEKKVQNINRSPRRKSMPTRASKPTLKLHHKRTQCTSLSGTTHSFAERTELSMKLKMTGTSSNETSHPCHVGKTTTSCRERGPTHCLISHDTQDVSVRCWHFPHVTLIATEGHLHDDGRWHVPEC